MLDLFFDQFEDWNKENKTLKKLPAKYTTEDHQWCPSLALEYSRDAAKRSVQCIENYIYNIKDVENRTEALAGLFKHAVDFSLIRCLDNTVTRVLLKSTMYRPSSDVVSKSTSSKPLRKPLLPYVGISIDQLECYIDADEMSTILYPSVESMVTKYLSFALFNLKTSIVLVTPNQSCKKECTKCV